MTIYEQLTRDEALRLKPYTDSVGKLTIGIGRNLTDRGISEAEAQMLLENDVTEVTLALVRELPWFAGLDDARKGVLINMGFNMGVPGLLQFRDTLASVKGGAYEQAAERMLESKWAMQVGARAHRLAVQMRDGIWQ